MMDPRYQTQQNSSDWMGKLNQIKAARRDYERTQSVMTPYERQTIWGNINADANANYGRIYQGIKQRFDSAKENYKSAAARRAAAIAKEINSWDSGKLNAEIQAYQTRVNMELSKQDAQGIFTGNSVSKRIAALYQEAQASGDRYKMRAAAEVLQAVNSEKLPLEQRFDVQLISREAIDQLETLRNTDEIKAGIEGENAAIKQMQDEQAFVKEAGAILADDQEFLGRAVGGFAKLAQTVKFERDGREVKIKLLELDDPEITGIHWSTDPTTQEMMKGENND